MDLQACPAACTGNNNVIAGTDSQAAVDIENVVRVNDVDGGRGSSVTVTGLGYNNGTTATVWLDNGVDLNSDGDITDANEIILRNDGVKQPQERELGSALVSEDDTFTLQVTVDNSPFLPGTLDETSLTPPVDFNGDGDTNDTSVNFNVINAIDGEARVADPDDVSFYQLEPSIQVSPTEAKVLDVVTVSLFDYPPRSTVTTISLGGVSVVVPSPAPVIGPHGEQSFTITIPDNANEGIQSLDVCASGSCADVNIAIGGP